MFQSKEKKRKTKFHGRKAPSKLKSAFYRQNFPKLEKSFY